MLDLKATLTAHALWRRGDPAGVRANLSGADLSGADLSWANLAGAYLAGANLTRADLSRADLSGTDLTRAYLAGARLFWPDLSGADLSGADLTRAYLVGANFTDVRNLPAFQIVPETGAFEGWKKLADGVIAHLRIPANAGRVSSTGRKCRAERAEVLALFGADHAVDKHSGKLRYQAGVVIVPDAWDPDWRVECTHGIHFFLTRAEAEAY